MTVSQPAPLPRASALSAGLCNASMLLYILWLLLPMVQTTGGAAAGVFTVLLFGAGVLSDGAWFRRHWVDFSLRALCVALIPLILWRFVGRGGSHFLGYYCQQAMFWFPLLYCSYARDRKDERISRFVQWALLAAVTVTTLTTIGWLVEGMLRGGRIYAYSRSLGFAEPGREAYLKELMLRNIGGYDFIYASVLCLPITCFAIGKTRGWARAGFAALCAAQFVMIVLSQYTYAMLYAALLLAVQGVALILRVLVRKAGRTLSVGASLLWALLPFAVVYLLRIPLVSLAASLCDQWGLTNFSFSLHQLLNMLTGAAVEEGSRLNAYLAPLNGFFQSPLLGSLTGREAMLGLHSDVLDVLSGLGLLGSAVFAGMIFLVGRGSLRGLRRHDALPTLLLQWIALAVIATLGTVVYSRDIALVAALSSFFLLREPS